MVHVFFMFTWFILEYIYVFIYILCVSYYTLLLRAPRASLSNTHTGVSM